MNGEPRVVAPLEDDGGPAGAGEGLAGLVEAGGGQVVTPQAHRSSPPAWIPSRSSANPAMLGQIPSHWLACKASRPLTMPARVPKERTSGAKIARADA